MPDHPLEIDVEALRDRLAGDADLLLVDCREQNEYDLVRLEPAVLIPMSELTTRVGELDSHRDREIVVHCHHGGRSLRVAMWLRQQGFARACSLAGGIDAWAERIDSSLPRY